MMIQVFLPKLTGHKSRLLKLLILATSIFIYLGGASYAEAINLGEGELYVKKGFDINWILEVPVDSSWEKISSTKKLRSLRVKDLPLEGVPRRSLFSMRSFSREDFTFLFPFDTTDREFHFPGLYVQDMGTEWEVYINGNLILQNHTDSTGKKLRTDRSLRKILAYIKPDYLKKGINIAAFRLSGNPADPITGFYRKSILIDDYEILEKNRSETITIVLIFIYLVFGLYHLFLYLNNRKERHYLFFGLASIAYFLYIFSRTRSIYSIITNPYIITKLEFIILYTIIPLFGSFIDLIVFKKINRFTKIYTLFCMVLISLSIFTPVAFAFDVLRIWQATALIPIFYYAFLDIGLSFYRKLDKRYNEYGVKSYRTFIRSLSGALGWTVEGNLIIGFFVIAGCVIFDILDAVYLSYGLTLSKYGFFAFITGIALILSNRFLFMMRNIESLNISLSSKIEDLDRANRIITISEEKYRLLVEGSNDLIFSLNEKMNFVTANKALTRILGTDDDNLGKMSFYDLIQRDEEGKKISLQLIREKIDYLIERKLPVEFKTGLKSKLKAEPQEMHVRLEYINVEGKNEILGKASSIMEDSLVKYFVSEKQSFEIGNFLIIAEEISHRITRNLLKYTESRVVDLVRVAVREIIVNAIEHGNMNITYDEKNESMEDGSFFDLLSIRQADPFLRSRKVKIEYKIDSSMVQYRIEDEGEGFNYREILGYSNKANVEMRSHGRGILMATNVFDSIRFNKKGNQVLLIKKFTV